MPENNPDRSELLADVVSDGMQRVRRSIAVCAGGVLCGGTLEITDHQSSGSVVQTAACLSAGAYALVGIFNTVRGLNDAKAQEQIQIARDEASERGL